MRKNWHDLRQLLRVIAARFSEDRCAQIAASLTFTTLLSLVPLITIALTLFSAFPVFQEFSTNIKNFMLAHMLPETGGKMISGYVAQFAESASRLTAAGILFLGLTAMLMMYTIENAFNIIWRVSFPRAVMQRVLIYWMVITLAPILIGASLTLTTWLISLSSGLSSNISKLEVNLLKGVSVLLTTLAFTLLFRIVPNRHVPLAHALIGGVVAAALFELMNRAFGYYISHFPTYRLVYGAFASIPIFLLWIYLSWLTVLIGALITAALPYWRGSPQIQSPPIAQLCQAVCALEMMNTGLKNGVVMTLPHMSQQLRIGFDLLEQVLDKLAQAGLVSKLAGAGWSLRRDIEHIQLTELYRLFILDPAALTDKNSQAEIRDWLLRLDACMVREDVTLHDLLSHKEMQSTDVQRGTV